eukprot:15348389-Ditylum_brightwellii.AAC.1
MKLYTNSSKRKDQIMQGNSIRDEENYNLVHNFNLIWIAPTHNTNDITKHASLDLVDDKTSWDNQGWGELASSDL